MTDQRSTFAGPEVLLTTGEMAAADRLAIAGGLPSLRLMENAGRAIADEAAKMVPEAAKIAVLCGPGNNGGDGFVAARLLRERGFDVSVIGLAERERLKSDAAATALQWDGPFEILAARPETEGRAACIDLALCPQTLRRADLIIDALFGAGLKRPLDGAARDLAQWTAELSHRSDRQRALVLSVDIPSGIDGNTGMRPTNAENGWAFNADRTITFFRRKPGHVLMDGRVRAGRVIVADIGLTPNLLAAIAPKTFVNNPALWQHQFNDFDNIGANKYTHGHAIIVSGPLHRTGAARLAARAALRVGAGLVTVASPIDAVAINAAQLTAVMVEPFDAQAGLTAVLSDQRQNAIVLGPGVGIGALTLQMTNDILKSPKAVVLDADALTSFAGSPNTLFELIQQHTATSVAVDVVLTPHEGEFKRLFPDLNGGKLARARAAAERSGANVVLKGPDTVIASPDGRAAINENAPPTLATAGSGDVLAGLVAGLLAQRKPAFEAACIAVWLHGECAKVLGAGLIAEDLPEAMPRVLTIFRRGPGLA
jgi:ADP-dependent NAD(P)H-hydrate dehydratase / NAD(P)H-hydrate epimerase